MHTWHDDDTHSCTARAIDRAVEPVSLTLSKVTFGRSSSSLSLLICLGDRPLWSECAAKKGHRHRSQSPDTTDAPGYSADISHCCLRVWWVDHLLLYTVISDTSFKTLKFNTAVTVSGTKELILSLSVRMSQRKILRHQKKESSLLIYFGKLLMTSRPTLNPCLDFFFFFAFLNTFFLLSHEPIAHWLT